MADSSADRDPLDRLAEDFVARLRRGERPSLTEYAERHPDLAEQVRDLFPALVEVEHLKPNTADRTGDYAPAAGTGASDHTRVGEFRIVRQVGRGGMGVVYEAAQESLGRHVALKILPPDAVADPKRLERFRREARAAAKLHHTNIVPVFGVGEADGRHYYAMQFIPGHPLDAVIDEVRRLRDRSAPTAPVLGPRPVSAVARALLTGTFDPAAAPGSSDPAGAPTATFDRPHGAAAEVSTPDTAVPPVSPPPTGAARPASPSSFSGSLTDDGGYYWLTVARIGAQVADALAYAHAQGVVHRDVKPANLLLDPRGTVWVTDFGLAKSADADDLTHAGDVVGTLRYMAPERFDGHGDARADTYALGLTLYELLTLTPAFTAENRAKLVEQVLAASPPRPRSIDPAIPRDLETIVLKAIARDPAMRYPSAGELADDLRRFTEDRPIRARRASSAEQAWRWCRRNKAVASLLAAVLVVFAAGAAVSAYFAAGESRRAREADGERAKAVAREREANDARRDADNRAAELKAEQERTDGLLYASQMNHAQLAAAEFRTPRLLELLAATTPGPGKRDPRGWEWHYLNRLARPAWESETPLEWATLLRSSPNAVRQTVTSRDGTRLVTTLGGGYDSATGRPVAPERRLPAELPAYGFPSPRSISPCGRYLAYFAATGPAPPPPPGPGGQPLPPKFDPRREQELPPVTVAVQLFELATGNRVPVPLPPVSVPRGPGAEGPAVWVSDGAERVTVVTNPAANGDPEAKRIGVWERAPRRVTERRIPTGAKRPGAVLEHLSPDGKTAVLLHSLRGSAIDPQVGGVLDIWDIEADPPELRASHATPGGFRPQSFSSSGRLFVASEDEGRALTVFDARTGARVGRWVPPVGTGGGGTALVSDDGLRVALTTYPIGDQGRLVVGDRVDGTRSDEGRWRTFVVRGVTSRNLWLSPDGARLATIEVGRGASGLPETAVRRVWNLSHDPDYAATWPDRLGVNGVPSPVRWNYRARLVNYNTYTAAAPFEAPPAGGHAVAVYDPAVGREVRRFAGSEYPISNLHLSPDRTRALLTYPLPTPPVGPAPPPDPKSPVPDARLTTLRTVGEPGGDRTLLELKTIPPNRMVPSPYITDDGRWVIETVPQAGLDESFLVQAHASARAVPLAEFKIWRAGDGRLSCTIPVRANQRSRLLHVPGTDGGRVLVATVPEPPGPEAGRDAAPVRETIACYDPVTGERLWAWLVPDEFAVESSDRGTFPAVPGAPRHVSRTRIQYSPDGHRLLVSSAGPKLLRAWVLDAARGEVLRDLRGPDGSGGTLPLIAPDGTPGAFGPNGWVVLVAGARVVVWDGHGAEPVHQLTGHVSGADRAVFSRDGRRLFTLDGPPLASLGSPDRRVRVWDLATGGELLAIPVPRGRTDPPSVGYPGRGGLSDESPMWLEGERLMLATPDGVRMFDGTPVTP